MSDTKTGSPDFEIIRRLEEALWREETRFDVEKMERVLADDFFEFGQSGRIYTRKEILHLSARPIKAVLPLPDFRIRWLSEDIAHVTYQSVVRYDGETVRANRSSLWLRTAQGWRLKFHQGTPIPAEKKADDGAQLG